MNKTPSWAFWVVIGCALCIFAALLVWGRAPESDELKYDTVYIDYSGFDLEGVKDTSGYFGMIESEGEKLFITAEAKSHEKADFGKETFSVARKLTNTDKSRWSSAVCDGKLYYSSGNNLCSVNLSGGISKTEHNFDKDLEYILVCGAYKNEHGETCVVVLTAALRNGSFAYFKEIYTYNTDTGKCEKTSDINIGSESHAMRYLVSDENYAYFGKFYNSGILYKLDLRTGQFDEFAANKTITSKKLENSVPNQAAVFENHLYFKVIGKPFGLYRANLESGEIEKYFKAGFTGNIAAFCIEDGILYAAVQSEAVGELGYPDYLGTYAVYTIDTKTGDFEKISEDIEILSEVRGMAVEGNKALIFGSHPSFVDIERT